MQRLNDVLDRRWLTNSGQYLREFEQRVAGFVNTKHCIAMCNGENALQIAIKALGLTGEVIVPAFTFVATAHALQWQGITPVFADMDPITHLIDPAICASSRTPSTSNGRLTTFKPMAWRIASLSLAWWILTMSMP